MRSGEFELAQLPAEEENSGFGQFNERNFGPAADGPRDIPPADRGRAAYLFLLACFMVEALVWGFSFSFGIFQEYYTRAFPGQTNIAVIGTCCMGITYLSAPLVFSALTRWPKLRRPATLGGLLIMCVALATASFATSVTQLIVTHGILYAIGGSICYSPTILFVNEWFIQRKGLAFGIMWAGTGVSGVVLPLVFQWLLHSYGFRTTLRIWSLTLFILTFPLLHYLKPRLPLENTPRNRKLFDMRFLFSPTFVVLQTCNVVEALGFFLPGIYLPTFATETLKTSPLVGAGTVILVNVASVFGCVCMGTLTDRFHVTTCILVSTVGATVGVFLLWGFSTSLPLLYLFCIVYGLFAGSFSSTWTGVINATQSRVENADSGLIFSFLAFGRGVGNVVSGPLSEALVAGRPWLNQAGMAYGTGYGPLITFTGISALLGGCSFFVRQISRNSVL
ncbi:uncharacterized protein PV09_00204 [Verruconis gallopava]|uniref:Major facilitator superfamily (MFS) profile domain-containing protein n=1 Tax=Verruconis gallopava TaxID=253628 RepID=A0A0D1Z8F1_9PEZI|nr:uncharacterized protein PV09_00204 [Verruconis gallopava]KIW09287.1 hypothetical protein PV09_00204 [Verruconis gallopava]